MDKLKKIKTKITVILGLILSIFIMPSIIISLVLNNGNVMDFIFYIAAVICGIASGALIISEIIFSLIFVDLLGGFIINRGYETLAIIIYGCLITILIITSIYDIYHQEYSSINVVPLMLCAILQFNQRIIIYNKHMMIYRSIIPIASIVSFRRKDDAAFSRKNGYLVIKLVNGKELVYRNRKDKVTKLCEELERIKNQSIEHIV